MVVIWWRRVVSGRGLIVGWWWWLIVVFIFGRRGRWIIGRGWRRIIAGGRLAIVGLILRLGVFCRRAVMDLWLVWGNIAACRLVLVRLATHRRPEVVDDRVLPVVGRVSVVGIGRRIGGWVGDRLRLDDVLDVASGGGNLDPGDLHPWMPRRGTLDHRLAFIIAIAPVKVRSLEGCDKLWQKKRQITWL